MAFFHLPTDLWQWFKDRHFGRNSIDSRYALLEACIIGFCSALAALLIKNGVNALGTWRLQSVQTYGAIAVLPLAGFVFCWLAGWIVERFSPAAAGGGIPQVKAALARYPMELSWRVAVVKLLGTVLILGGGLTLGRRAPTVHIGAALAGQLSRWLPTSPEHRRQMIAAGAAAGLAAGFMTPIAGVLFVVEELMRDVSSLTLETAIVASFVGAVTSLILQSKDLSLPHQLTQSLTIQFSVSEIPFYLLLGAIAGILGALFNQGILFSKKIHRQMNLSLPWRLSLVGLLSGTIIAFMPPFLQDNAALKDILLTGELSKPAILAAFIAHFLLTMIAYSSDAPGGLFAPALIMGSALGYLVGGIGDLWTQTGTESTYALAGMGAFFTSVVRVPVTAIVIVFELTGNFNIVLPLMVACAVSYMVAESIFPRSLYEHLLEAKGIFLTEKPTDRDFLTSMTAYQVMQREVESLDVNQTLAQVLPIMSKSHHRGFPVVEEGRLVGVFTQTDLANAQAQSVKISLRELMTPNPITVVADAPLS
ncbi:MAG: chloride channel protein, partial [Microcystaceae cyanobacterium]